MWQFIYTQSGGEGGGSPLIHPEVALAGVWVRQPLLGNKDNLIRLGKVIFGELRGLEKLAV